MRRVSGLVFALFCLLTVSAAPHVFAQTAVADKQIAEQGDGYDFSFTYPQTGVAAADAAMQDFAQGEVASFKSALGSRRADEPPYFAELTYTIPRNDESMLSVLFAYSFYTGGAHPNSTTTAFNFLMPDGARVFLPELIGSAGIQRVSDLAIADLNARLTGPNGLSDPDWIRSGAGPYADNFETFEWLPDEVVLKFDPYQVASYAVGPQEVHISRSQVNDLLRPDPRAPLPSFDCGEAATDVEHAICSDMQLAQLDRRTAEAFAMRLRFEELGDQQPKVRAEQQAWLGQRDAACAGSADAALVSCLDQQYAQRLSALRSFQ